MCMYMLWNTHMVDAPLLELSLASAGGVFFEGEDENENDDNNKSFNNSRASGGGVGASGYASSVVSSRYTSAHPFPTPSSAVPNATAHTLRKYISAAAPFFWLGMVLLMAIGGRCVSPNP